MSTTTLRNAVDITTSTAASQVAGVLTNLDACGRLNLAAADTVLADLAAADEPGDDDKARAPEAMNAGVRAHTLMVLVKACLRSLADPDADGQLDPALVDAIVAADPVVTESVSTSLRNAITPGDAVLPFALIAELRRAQRAAAATSAVPDTLPEGWAD